MTKTVRPVLCVRHAPYHVFLVHVNWAVDLAKESWPLNVTMILVAPKFQKYPPPGARASDSSSKCPFLILELTKSSAPFMAMT